MTLAFVTELFAGADYELQRLHGMGEGAHDAIVALSPPPRPVRVYAPVGTHRDLLAYLVRRLLENGANSSFVHQFSDPDVSAEEDRKSKRLNSSHSCAPRMTPHA